MKHFDVISGSTTAADAGDTPAAPAAAEAATAAAAFKPAARRPDRDNLLSSAIASSWNSDLLAEDADADAAGEGRGSSKVCGGGGVARKAADNITWEEAMTAAVVHSPSLMLSAAVRFACTGSCSRTLQSLQRRSLLLLSGRIYLLCYRRVLALRRLSNRTIAHVLFSRQQAFLLLLCPMFPFASRSPSLPPLSLSPRPDGAAHVSPLLP